MRLNSAPGNFSWDIQPMYDPPSLCSPVKLTPPPLPPFELCKQLYSAQYAYIGTIFSFIQPNQFEGYLRQIYAQRLDSSVRENRLIVCQVLMVLALGQMYSINQWTGNDGPPGFVYFKSALQFLPDIHEKGSVQFIEALCYVAYYMQNLNRRDAAFLYVSAR